MVNLSNRSGRSTINLSKNQQINLSKDKPGLKKIRVALGWDLNQFASGADADLDVSAFLVDTNGRCKEENFVFYNNLVAQNGAVKHLGDNRTGAGDGDDETIYIDLEKLGSDITKIAITITIHDPENKGITFGSVENAFCRLVNDETDFEEVRYDLTEEYFSETALVVAEIYKYGADWKFKTIGQGFANGLIGLCNRYGLQAGYN